MADVAPRVALIASAALHAALLLRVTLSSHGLQTEARVLPELWGGKTFEVPTAVADDPSSSAGEAPDIPIDVSGEPAAAAAPPAAPPGEGPAVAAHAPAAPPARPAALPRLASAP